MAREGDIQVVLGQITGVEACRACGTTIRFGIYECPHCGGDLEDVLRDWASRLLDALGRRSD
jgi:predicted RNA-binding Zn-ribbon protein involved in translation (DUF1610 family)